MIAALLLALATVNVNVDVTPAHALAYVDPMRAIGGGVDAEDVSAIPAIYGRNDVAQMLSAGLGSLTYRSNTELSVQDWHWNPTGTWSDAASGQGYWTGSSVPGSAIAVSYGYDLPERGFTNDQGYNLGYSRLDDGNASTFWKSNPYLTQRFDGEPDALHPQWALVDLGIRRGIDAIRIAWGSPYATSYRVQYWTGYDAIYAPTVGHWSDFPSGTVSAGRGGSVTLHLAGAPFSVRYVRVLMTASSNTCDAHGSSDARNCVGYAIQEIGVGTISNGRFDDAVRHAPNHRQTTTYVSSVDPWHAPSNRAAVPVQPGFDDVFRSGLTRGLPALLPVSLLYGTPDDAAAEVGWLRARHYELSGVELGEEPDGQFVAPEDYGALYVQWARRMHAIDPSLKLGGPAFAGTNADVQTWPDASGDVSWMRRFLHYLSAHAMLSSLQFVSFEHYPYDACVTDPYAAIETEPALASAILQTWRRDGVPPRVPLIVDEANFSADAVPEFQDVPGALWLADAIGAFLSGGASALYLYQYAPEPIQRTSTSCNVWGSYGMFAGNGNYTVRQRTAEYFAASLVTSQWAQFVDARQTIFPAVATAGGRTQQLVTSYAIERFDGTTALMLVNKDPQRAVTATIQWRSGSGALRLTGTMTEATFGRAQYVWHGDGYRAFAAPD
ncbi:MAG: discoidin domain-containing protein, partial [Candidatus Eremiobacteraeota bacterium]|nr:discoidin domain-containing protein [Candidatus Eremiobacteraeota bacterium]